MIQVPSNMNGLGIETEEGLNQFMSSLLTLEDTFQFGCNGCGRCCLHRDDIILSPEDIHRICGYLNRTPAEFIDQYTVNHVGAYSHLPVLVLKSLPPDGRCPFLRTKKCAIHPVKPAACVAFPLARVTALTDKSPRFSLQKEVSCGYKNHTVRVKDWIGHLATEESQQAAVIWTSFLGCYSRAVREKKWNSLTPAQRNMLLAVLFTLLYRGMDPKKPLLSELKKVLSCAIVFLAANPELRIQLETVPLWVDIQEIGNAEVTSDLLFLKAYTAYEQEQGNVQMPPETKDAFRATLCHNTDWLQAHLSPADYALWQKIKEEKLM